MQTIQQKRAKYALDMVKKAAERLKNEPQKQNEFKSYASGLPAMIHMNGLGQAAAFYRSKGGVHLELYQLLSDWLTGENQPFHVPKKKSDLLDKITNSDMATDQAPKEKSDLLDRITNSNMATYQQAQAEAQALMDWVKKFAKAFMGGDD